VDVEKVDSGEKDRERERDVEQEARKFRETWH
jgi:hypothetical protein